MSEPRVGTNIYTIWHDVLSDSFTSIYNLRIIISDKFPAIPVSSVSTHLQSLVNRGFAVRTGTLKDTRYKRSQGPENKSRQLGLGRATSYVKPILKSQIGKHVTVSMVNQLAGFKNTNLGRVLYKMERDGYLKRVDGAKPIAFLVLPSIGQLSIPAPTQEPILEPLPITSPDITSMTIGELFQNAMNLRDENVRLKTTLESIGQLLLQAGIVEE
ncbi:MAG: hypothetical protein ACC707_14880 [Thiohalomonadales bacterium]